MLVGCLLQRRKQREEEVVVVLEQGVRGACVFVLLCRRDSQSPKQGILRIWKREFFFDVSGFFIGYWILEMVLFVWGFFSSCLEGGDGLGERGMILEEVGLGMILFHLQTGSCGGKSRASGILPF